MGEQSPAGRGPKGWISAALHNPLVTALIAAAVTFLLTATLDQKTANEQREIAAVTAVRADISNDLTLYAHLRTNKDIRALLEEADTSYQTGNTAFDSTANRTTEALHDYEVALAKLHQATAAAPESITVTLPLAGAPCLPAHPPKGSYYPKGLTPCPTQAAPKPVR